MSTFFTKPAPLQSGTTARAGDINDRIDATEYGFDQVEETTTRSVKLPVGTTTDQVISATPSIRANKALGFDNSGNLQLQSGFQWRGDWTAATEYVLNNAVRDTVSSDLYFCLTDHTSSAAFSTDSAYWDLGVDVSDTAASAQDSANSAALSEEWATKLGSPVDSTEYSAKHYATSISSAESNSAASASAASSSASAASSSATSGGIYANAASIASTNASASETTASEWATKLGSPVDSTEYSAKHYATSIQPQLDTKLEATITENVDFDGYNLKNYSEYHVAQSLNYTPTPITIRGNQSFRVTINATGTLELTIPTSSVTKLSGYHVTIILTVINSGSYAVLFANGMSGGNAIKWAGGTAPSITANGRDIFVFTTYDGGSNWDGFIAGQGLA
jgi:hypothetical protein